MNELKYEIEGAFEGFLDEHKEYTKPTNKKSIGN